MNKIKKERYKNILGSTQATQSTSAIYFGHFRKRIAVIAFVKTHVRQQSPF